MVSNAYFIGGSPCSGKSTIAEKISSEYDMLYYKADDHFQAHIKQALKNNIEEMIKLTKMTCDDIWLNRTVEEQFADTVQFYRQEVKMCIQDIAKMKTNKPIIAEGAVFMPSFMNDYSIPQNKFFCLIPSFDFQMHHYKKREWVKEVLKDSSDKKKAFSNWMERDYKFSRFVKAEANKFRYASYEINNQTDDAVLYKEIINAFELNGTSLLSNF